MADIAFEKDRSVTETGIGGLKVVDLAVHGDSRGWFKENWQRAKMCALGIPDLRVVQNNVSYNDSRGVTRGIHAEPWDKFISVARGSVFGAWVDLREGSETFGKVFTTVLDPSKAIYVPRGVGNSFQALEDGTAYTYLVDAHWSLELKKTYTFVNLADPELAIEWPPPSPRPTSTTRCSGTSSQWRPRGRSSPAATASWAMLCAGWRRSAASPRTSTSATSTPSTCPTRTPIRGTTGRSTAP